MVPSYAATVRTHARALRGLEGNLARQRLDENQDSLLVEVHTLVRSSALLLEIAAGTADGTGRQFTDESSIN
jgi:hypothetical protein